MRLPLRVRVAAALCLVALGLFAVATFANNVPRGTGGPLVAKATGPFRVYLLRQDWRLFGPNPPAYQHETLLEVRYSSGGRTVESAPTDIEYAADDLIRSDRLLPSKMAAFPLAFERMSVIVASPRRARTARARRLADTVLRRYGSLYADSLYPGREISEVRIIMVNSLLRRAGSARPRGDRSRAVTADTGWLPYAAGVGR